MSSQSIKSYYNGLVNTLKLNPSQLNGRLAQKNQQIGPRDALIAGTALHWGLDLLTLNVNEFKRVPRLGVVAPSL